MATTLAQSTMYSADQVQNFQPSAGGKRPEASSADEDREVKRPRAQLYDDNEDRPDNGAGSLFDSFTGGEVANGSLNLTQRRQKM